MATSNDFNKFGLFSRTARACRHMSMLQTRAERKAGLQSATKARVENADNRRDHRWTNVHPPLLQEERTTAYSWSGAGVREVSGSMAVPNMQRAPLVRATDAAQVTEETCSCTVGTACHVNICTAALGTEETGTPSTQTAPSSQSRGFELLQQLFFLQHYRSLSLGHSSSIPGSRKSTCSYHPENDYFSKAVNQQSKNLNIWGYLSWS